MQKNNIPWILFGIVMILASAYGIIDTIILVATKAITVELGLLLGLCFGLCFGFFARYTTDELSGSMDL